MLVRHFVLGRFSCKVFGNMIVEAFEGQEQAIGFSLPIREHLVDGSRSPIRRVCRKADVQ